MPDEPSSEPRSGPAWTWWALWACFLVFIVYPLSSGPAIKLGLAVGSNSLWACIYSFYTPLRYLCDHSDIAQGTYRWYLGLWGVTLA